MTSESIICLRGPTHSLSKTKISNIMRIHKLPVLAIAFLLGSLLLFGCSDSDEQETGNGGKDNEETNYDLENFPEGANPKTVGIKLVERFLNTGHSYWGNITSDNVANHVTYPDVCAWMGAFWFAKDINNTDLYNKLVDRFDPLFSSEKHLQPSLSPSADNIVDYYVFGAIPLEIYKDKKEDKYLELGMKYADGQWTLPANATTAQKNWHNDGR